MAAALVELWSYLEVQSLGTAVWGLWLESGSPPNLNPLVTSSGSYLYGNGESEKFCLGAKGGLAILGMFPVCQPGILCLFGLALFLAYYSKILGSSTLISVLLHMLY